MIIDTMIAHLKQRAEQIDDTPRYNGLYEAIDYLESVAALISV